MGSDGLARRRVVAGALAAGATLLFGRTARAGRFAPVPPWFRSELVDMPAVPPTTTSSTSTTTSTTSTTTTSTTSTTLAPATDIAPPVIGEPRDVVPVEPPDGWERRSIGTSFGGREIEMFVRPAPPEEPPIARVLVLGSVHGNEPAVSPMVRRMLLADIPASVEPYIVPECNPDAWAANSRYNDNGVDINRNFPWRWAAWDGGPGPASEPETQAIMALISTGSFDAVVWVHQPLGYVAAVGSTPQAWADAWRAPTGLAARLELDQHGGGETWTNLVAGRPSLLVEADGWAVSDAMIAQNVAGYEAFLSVLAPMV